ncbi:recombinase family protein [Streptomyces sp. NPDC051322]|uniref:recombinase family protein n=1 Tax=Streptomyces sp. NPDC051322 TaxID=3154645 RepID=UPI00344F8517
MFTPERRHHAGESGAKQDRPQIMRLERDAQANKIDVVAVHKFDRIGRTGRAFCPLAGSRVGERRSGPGCCRTSTGRSAYSSRVRAAAPGRSAAVHPAGLGECPGHFGHLCARRWLQLVHSVRSLLPAASRGDLRAWAYQPTGVARSSSRGACPGPFVHSHYGNRRRCVAWPAGPPPQATAEGAVRPAAATSERRASRALGRRGDRGSDLG